MKPLLIGLILGLLSGIAAQAAGMPSPQHRCFKPVFKKTVQQYQWRVFECVDFPGVASPESSMFGWAFYHVTLVRPDGSRQTSRVIGGFPQEDTFYALHGPDLLQINLKYEQNGNVSFLHPVEGQGKALSVVQFEYESGEEDTLQVVRSGPLLTFKPAANKMKVHILPDGQLQLQKK